MDFEGPRHGRHRNALTLLFVVLLLLDYPMEPTNEKGLKRRIEECYEKVFLKGLGEVKIGCDILLRAAAFDA